MSVVNTRIGTDPLRNYQHAKLRLLDQLKPSGFAVLNADDPVSRTLIDECDCATMTIGIESRRRLDGNAAGTPSQRANLPAGRRRRIDRDTDSDYRRWTYLQLPVRHRRGPCVGPRSSHDCPRPRERHRSAQPPAAYRMRSGVWGLCGLVSYASVVEQRVAERCVPSAPAIYIA